MIKDAIANGLLLSLLISFDLRFAYLVLCAVVLYSIIHHSSFIIHQIVIPILVSVFVHAFWILPALLTGSGIASKGAQYTDPNALSFFSFADFSHALSLLHPNWPENLFGKVYFLQPEFLILPILAFAALVARLKIHDERLTINNKKANNSPSLILNHSSLIRYFVLLALLGAFLAKGVNPPFGGIFSWMFTHVPGFVMFRDPTKFYLYTAIGYSILIPYSLQPLAGLIKDQRLMIKDKKERLSSFILHPSSFIIFIVFWLFTLRPVFFGQMNGNFRPLILTDEYVRLKDMLVADTRPSRVLWLPKKDAFAFASPLHPLLTTEELFGRDEGIGANFSYRLNKAGVGYVVVPQDLEKRIFLDNYRFDPSQRKKLIDTLDATPLKRDTRFANLAVYRNDQFTMEAEIPLTAIRQQALANTGLVVSVVSLIIAVALIIFK